MLDNACQATLLSCSLLHSLTCELILKYSRFAPHVHPGQWHVGDSVIVPVARVTEAVFAVDQPERVARVPRQVRHVTLNDGRKASFSKAFFDDSGVCSIRWILAVLYWVGVNASIVMLWENKPQGAHKIGSQFSKLTTLRQKVTFFDSSSTLYTS